MRKTGFAWAAIISLGLTATSAQVALALPGHFGRPSAVASPVVSVAAKKPKKKTTAKKAGTARKATQPASGLGSLLSSTFGQLTPTAGSIAIRNGASNGSGSAGRSAGGIGASGGGGASSGGGTGGSSGGSSGM